MTPFQRNVLHVLAFAGLALQPLASHAVNLGGDYAFPAGDVRREPAPKAASTTCAEATRAAWFRRQIEITDGDVSPTIATPPECERKVFAKSDARRTH